MKAAVTNGVLNSGEPAVVDIEDVIPGGEATKEEDAPDKIK